MREGEEKGVVELCVAVSHHKKATTVFQTSTLQDEGGRHGSLEYSPASHGSKKVCFIMALKFAILPFIFDKLHTKDVRNKISFKTF